MNDAPLEKYIQRRIQKELKKLGHRSVKYPGGRFGETGVSDLLCCICGRFVAIEVKRPGKQATGPQRAFLDSIRASGGLTMVGRSWEHVAAFLWGIWWKREL